MELHKSIDKSYWSKPLPHPLSPNDKDVIYYKKNLIVGTTLFLGCTHKLLNISNFQMDVDPWYESSTVIVKNWINNKRFYTNIIGDGVFNFTKDLTDQVLSMCEKYCNNLIVRSFSEKLPNMKVANYFPSYDDFKIKPHRASKFKKYYFFVWKF